jgi:hypothetical protein
MGDLVNAAKAGDVRKTLLALRDRLAEEIEGAGARDLAPLSRQLTAVLAEIDALPNTEKSSAADEIAQRRADRRKAAGNESH